MTAKPTPVKLLIATGNPGKAREIAAEMAPMRQIECVSLKDLPAVPECEETGETFEENAIQKAKYYAEHFHCLTLADDSGLEVDALDRQPGVYSARYAGEPCDDQANNDKLVRELASVPSQLRSARFRCVMALVDAAGSFLGTTQGTIEGIIIDQPRGKNGFGYDPHFYLPDRDKTTAELSPEEKNRISHRGQATRAMHTLLESLIQAGKL
jgi:XTP/dITP diphosphohydrolase